MLFMYLYLVKYSFFRAFYLWIDFRTIFCWWRSRSKEFSLSYTYVYVHWWCCTELWNYFKYLNKNVNVHSCSSGCLWPFLEERQKFFLSTWQKWIGDFSDLNFLRLSEVLPRHAYSFEPNWRFRCLFQFLMISVIFNILYVFYLF